MKLSNPVHSRLNKVRKLRKTTYNDLITSLLNLLEEMEEQEPLYAVGDKLYNNLAEARGEAILVSVKKKKSPEFPIVLYAIGKDEGL